MKHKSYNLKIENPCSQNWHSMTQNNIGKYCSQCSSHVIDLTTLTDAQIIQIIENKNTKFCGRLTNQQLNRCIEISQDSKKSLLYKLIAGLMLFGGTNNTIANDFQTLETGISFNKGFEEISSQNFEKTKEAFTDSIKNTLRGKAIDSITKEPLSFASVSFKDNKNVVLTDIEGNFKLIIPDSLMNKTITIVIATLGYEKTEITIDNSDLHSTKEILLIPAKYVLMGDIYIVEQKKWWQFWK